eukprot:CAMPEP_0184695230 /NCGR_PEP_ID=MMETSP0313-20130426/2926_1 /TAXON_ID=2792 /ORGANISM="Porphyridium aerugineum, Strain SAG 1380-2" /LENGTH=1807 /DNA_ID=CAMNT_0027153651 /DNA_START=584 /DNA_END=6007 /DNA_ORIENTATION=-
MVTHAMYRRNANPVDPKAYVIPAENRHVQKAVTHYASLCKPKNVVLCDGSNAEYQKFVAELVSKGTYLKLNEELRRNSYLARSDPKDVGIAADSLFVCTTYKEDAGFNQWREPEEAKDAFYDLYDGCMAGKTMYVVPFALGPLNSSLTRFGVQITDSLNIVCHLHVMLRVGTEVLAKLGKSRQFSTCVHSVGSPLESADGKALPDKVWPCNDKRMIAHFPEELTVLSFGSNLYENLLGRKTFALRASSSSDSNNVWTAENMMVTNVINPEGQEFYIAGSFPQGCGKSNLSMIVPTVPGFKQKVMGDELVFFRIDEQGLLRAICPEQGFFDLAPGTSNITNPASIQMLRKDAIFTNVAYNPDTGDVWWEGMTKETPAKLVDWSGQQWTAGCGRLAADPSGRYAAPARCNPVLDPRIEDPEGVVISAFLFGGRRTTTVPLVFETLDWNHGAFMASSRTHENEKGEVSIVPTILLRATGYECDLYEQCLMEMGAQLKDKAPKVFYINLFRTDDKGNYMWPGFSENSRIYQWIVNRLKEGKLGKSSPIGIVPKEGSIDTTNLNVSDEVMKQLLAVNPRLWLEDMPKIRAHQEKLGASLPAQIKQELTDLELRLHFASQDAPTTNSQLLDWINQVKALVKPTNVYWCDGSKEEFNLMCDVLVRKGTMIPLNPKKRPHSFLARSDPSDVARVESRTFICSKTQEEAGPTNNWFDPTEMRKIMNQLYDGSMQGRTMYVIPFSMGVPTSPYARIGIEITDSEYVVANMHVMTRVGFRILRALGNGPFVKCMHSVGKPLKEGEKDVPWPCNDNKYICHFPDDMSIMSYGSNYGGNSLLGKKCLALRIGSLLGRQQGWMAEHMLIMRLTNPQGQKFNICAALPSACGKTNLAMLSPSIPGWKAELIGDDIAWLNVGKDGRLWAINPESGIFGVAPGTSPFSNLSAIETLKDNSLFTNCALTKDGDIWWEGLTDTPPEIAEDWQKKAWEPGCGRLAAHPNARYTAWAKNCPVISDKFDDPYGVPIDAILFGGRRASTVPLVVESFDWNHGVFMGSMCSSEQTAAAEGKQGELRFDPYAMLPFCAYNMGDYMKDNWLKMGERLGKKAPKIFYINWFRKDEKGKFMWPGFGDNARVLKWITERCTNASVNGVPTPIGIVPSQIDTAGLKIQPETLKALLHVDATRWIEELSQVRAFHSKFGTHWPEEIHHELTALEQRLHFAASNAVPTTNKKLLDWVKQVADLVTPDHIHWCDGTEEEYQMFCDLLVENKTFVRLNPKKRPNSFLCRSDPSDVARVESRTFICAEKERDAGPTNNWRDPVGMHKEFDELFKGVMKGRVMYVIPFSMGPVGTSYCRYGVEITDSAYVCVNMRIMTRIGFPVLKAMGDGFFLPCLHSVGKPLQPGEKDVPWPCNATKYISHFPQEPSVISFGSGYGGNALLGKKCYSLRIGSVLARKDKGMAEHMLILSLKMKGKTFNIAAAFPSACGKTNLAMLTPTLPGMTVTCRGDDIAWFHIGKDGRLWAINPENGFFGVAPGTSDFSNHSAMETVKKDSIFTNTALTPDGDVWWEGMTKVPPPQLEDWQYKPWTPDCGRPSSHPNSRYTCYAKNCPVIDPDFESPVPIHAIIFGGRRERTVPLVMESKSWEHGVFMGSLCSSEQTAAAEGKVGALRIDPMAMIPFIGYNVNDYLQHWLDMGKEVGADKLPKIFYVNWFRKDEKGKFMWPGFGDNSRVLQWICERVDGTAKAVETPVGFLPTVDAIDTTGLDIPKETMQQLLQVDKEGWLRDLPMYKEFYDKLGSDLPAELSKTLSDIQTNLEASKP